MINTSEDAKASLDKRSCVAKGIITVSGNCASRCISKVVKGKA